MPGESQKNSEISISHETREQLEIKPADCVVVFGRGIETVNLKQAGSSATEVWKPTRYIQRLEKSEGQNRPMRTGKRSLEKPLESFSPEDKIQEMVGGGTANVIATAHIYELLQKRGQTPKEIIISGGRPGYLEKEEPNITEAKVMKSELLRRLKADSIAMPKDLFTLIEHSRNTKDDLVNSLRLCHEHGYKKVALVNASIAMGRTLAFYETIRDNPKDPDAAIFKELDIQFIPADDVLNMRMGKHFDRIKAKLVETKAYKQTLENERIGEEKAHKSEYGQDVYGKGNY